MHFIKALPAPPITTDMACPFLLLCKEQVVQRSSVIYASLSHQ